ncbi:hypothetical protein [Kribbella sp. NBC_00359]|uniref:hypothetical protein n=1 Tax=Kribbella sp. NBC_00359 TaxID=2975966 RepID=UPI002E210DB4
MSIQYVTVRVDTTGLFQPSTMAQGVIGVIGPAIGTTASTRNPELFTQPLVGARGEPYAQVVRVLPISAANEPLGLAGNPLGGSGGNLVDSLGRDRDAENKPVAVPGLKVDATGGYVGDDGTTPVATDRSGRPQRFDGIAYQQTYLWYPPAEQPAQVRFGIPVDGRGRPIPDLRMDTDGTFTSLDGQTGFPVNPNSGYPERPAAGGNPAQPITTLDYGLGDLARAVNLALNNGAVRVWAFRTDRGGGVPTRDDAFTDFADRQINVVVLANNTDATAISDLRTHVEAASPNDAGGGGTRPRIGVAMLPREGWTSNGGGNPQPSQRLSDFGIDWTSSRMVLLAHKSRDDVAAAVAGRIVRYDPWISLTMKELTGISQTDRFSDSEVAVWVDPEAQGIAQARVNPIIDPEFLPGAGLVMGESYTADGTGQRLYIDIVRSIDDIAFRLKANLTNPSVIGTLRVNRVGLTGLRTLVSALLDARVAAGEIDSYAVDIPVLAPLQKDPAQRTAEETQQINDVQNSRRLEFSVSVDYAGAIHYLIVTLRFV